MHKSHPVAARSKSVQFIIHYGTQHPRMVHAATLLVPSHLSNTIRDGIAKGNACRFVSDGTLPLPPTVPIVRPRSVTLKTQEVFLDRKSYGI